MCFILAVLLSGSTAFANLVGNDSDYRVREVDAYRFIYSTEYEQLTNEMVAKNSVLRDIYQKEFSWQLDEQATLVLASSKNQITNGFATQQPRLWTLFYNGGPGAIDRFGTTSWADTLLIHETAHLYQLNTRQGLSSTLKSLLGTSGTPLMFPNYMITPNIFTPTLMMEGNATFNEGRFGNGGRLYSAFYRAMFLQLLKADKLTDSRAINDHIDWPFGTEKYIVGGYFNSYLAEEFSPSQANRFFYVNSARYVWPFLFDDSFKANYDGNGFYSLFEAFKKKYKPLAENQKQLDKPVLTFSHSHSGFTVNGDVVTFMTTESQGLNKLCMFHKTKKQLKCEKIKIPFGRVFRHNKEWVSASYQQTHPTEIRAGLFSDGYRRIDDFNDRYVYSKKGKHIVYADTKNSFDKTRVYKNGQAVGELQSSPYMDKRGNLYYFKQNGERRYMYKNGRQQFSIYGHYGRVVDVNPQGKVYFTGPTRSGVSLFSWDGSAYYQEVDSDLVFDAKLLADRDILVAEVTHEGIETKVVKQASQAGAPILYQYSYQDPKIQRSLKQATPVTSEALDYEYSPLLEMEYNGVSPVIGYTSPDGAIWSLDFAFSDPLQKYNSNLIIGDGGFESYMAQWILRSKVNRLQWAFSALYDEDAITTVVNGETKFAASIGQLDLDLQLIYPLITTPLWHSNFSFGYSYESRFAGREELLTFTGTGIYSNAAILNYDFNYSFQNNLDYSAARYAGLELGYKHEADGGDWSNATPVYVGKTKLQWDVLWQSFLSASYEAAYAEGSLAAIELDQSGIPISFDPSDIFRLGDETIASNYYELRKANAEFKQAINVKQYFSRVPLGIHRIAPYVGYSEFYGSNVRNQAGDTLFHESYSGLEAEVLVFHKFTMLLNAVAVESSLGLTRKEFTLGMESDF